VIDAVLVYRFSMLQKFISSAAWLILAFIAYSTLSPIGLRPTITDPNIERFVAYAILGFLLGTAYPRRFLRVALAVIGTAMLLEVLQVFAVGRHGELRDFLFKGIGGLAGVMASEFTSRLTRGRGFDLQ
jgi:VanZ family protein